MSVFSGVIYHAVGGGAAASFYLPFKKVKQWAWESYWLISGVGAWIVMPWLIGYLTVPELLNVLSESPGQSLFYCFFFGLLWGIGGLTFGLSMRYLGLSLGYAVALGFCAVFGTIVPPVFEGTFVGLFANTGGQLIILGVFVCLVGIAVSGRAGILKDKELTAESKKSSIVEFNLNKGIIIAFISGLLSACMAFGISAGKPIAQIALQHGVNELWQNNATLVVVLAGGFTTNFIWCVVLNLKNKTMRDYRNGTSFQLFNNYFFSLLAGAIWYMQFFFYGMGTTQMGKFDFASWTLHMSFIIIFSNVWGFYLKEWKGTSAKTRMHIYLGILTIFMAILLIGRGTYIGG